MTNRCVCVRMCAHAWTQTHQGCPLVPFPPSLGEGGDSELWLSVLRGVFWAAVGIVDFWCNSVVAQDSSSPLILLPPPYSALWNEVPQSWPLLQRAWHPSWHCSAKLWNILPSPSAIMLCPRDSCFLSSCLCLSFCLLPLNLSCVCVRGAHSFCSVSGLTACSLPGCSWWEGGFYHPPISGCSPALHWTSVGNRG